MAQKTIDARRRRPRRACHCSLPASSVLSWLWDMVLGVKGKLEGVVVLPRMMASSASVTLRSGMGWRHERSVLAHEQRTQKLRETYSGR